MHTPNTHPLRPTAQALLLAGTLVLAHSAAPAEWQPLRRAIGHAPDSTALHPIAHNGSVEIRIGGHFNAHQRMSARAHYGRGYHGAHCPPGLAKKGAACSPPGHVRGWRLGQRLPPDLVYYPVSPEVLLRLGPPPAGHRYVRVATDLLLIAIGTGMVVDAIEDLGQL